MSQGSTPAAYQVDPGQVGRDREAILAVWHGNLGEDARMGAKFDWFYAQCPFGEPSVCLLRAAPQAAPIGVAAAGPRRLMAAAGAIEAGVLVDLAVAAAHRSLGPAMMLQTALAEVAGQRFGLLYGFPNPKAAPVFKRIGYSKLGEMIRYARVLRYAGYLARRLPRPLARLASLPLDFAVRLRDAWRARADRRWSARWSDAADARFDTVWAASLPIDGALAIRNTAFARWRFDACPLEKTRYLLLENETDGTLHAWFACQSRGDLLHVRDFWALDASRGLDRACIDALLRAARKAGHAAVSVEIAAEAGRLDGWLGAGFSARSRRPVYGKWTRDGAMPPLFLTSADEDE